MTKINWLKSNYFLFGTFVAGLLCLYNIQSLLNSNDVTKNRQELLYHIDDLEKNLLNDDIELTKLQSELRSLSKNEIKDHHKEKLGTWDQPIPVLTFVCNRANALKHHLMRLTSIRKSSKINPIVVSQDCEDKEVAEVINLYKDEIIYIKQSNTNVTIPETQRRYAMYYKIAQHYKLGLNYIFATLNFTSVIITEDDLDISEDFFDYFTATRPLLNVDSTLYCISAWNDNGKSELIDHNANNLFYRSDFFPGLGWMMSSDILRSVWNEFENRWPNGFWDDWIREPEQRRNRACIRPEISRTAMTKFGKTGASRGLFFNRHLKKIMLNTKPLGFSSQNLDYLLKWKYDAAFFKKVYECKTISLEKLLNDLIFERSKKNNVYNILHDQPAYRVEYRNMSEYTKIAIALRLMPDTKAGVPRTAYHGIVTCFIKEIRLYIAPVQTPSWSGYQLKWEAPAEVLQSFL